MEIRLEFTEEEIVQYLRGKEFQVELREVRCFGTQEEWPARVWQVLNPITNTWENAQARFREVFSMSVRKNMLGELNRLDILQCFEQVKC